MSSQPDDGPAWISVCEARLAQLMPRLTAAERNALAQAMRREVGYFDPLIAAELEIESWPTDD